MKILRILLVPLLALALVAGTGSEGSRDYAPPYAVGPTGGDQYNLLHHTDDGRIVAARAYPQPSFLSCAAKGGYRLFQVTHRAEREEGTVSIDFSDAVVDPYVFVTINVIDGDGEFLGTAHERGPLTGNGELTVPLQWPVRAPNEDFVPRDIRIQFGLEITSACPSADAGTIKFDVVRVGD